MVEELRHVRCSHGFTDTTVLQGSPMPDLDSGIALQGCYMRSGVRMLAEVVSFIFLYTSKY